MRLIQILASVMMLALGLGLMLVLFRVRWLCWPWLGCFVVSALASGVALGPQKAVEGLLWLGQCLIPDFGSWCRGGPEIEDLGHLRARGLAAPVSIKKTITNLSSVSRTRREFK